MKVELEKAFPLPAAPAAAWTLLQDIEAVAACMPGAKITQRTDATHYKGTVTVRVGPATLSFRGDIEVREINAAARTLRIFGSGSDTTGASAGSMDLNARIDAAEGGLATLNGRSVVSLSGKAAAFGGRMVNSVADQILGQFARNFAARVEAPAPPSGPPSATTGAARGATAVQSATPGAATLPTTATTEAAPAAPGATGDSPPVGAAATSPTAASTVARMPVANEINAFALLWAICRDWLRGLFRRKRA